VLSGALLLGILSACGSQETSSDVSPSPSETATSTAVDSVQVEAPTGTYVGRDNDGVAEFQGIRYGVFRPYLPATDVTTTSADVIEATSWGYNCIQPYDEVELASQDPCSQDCLFLNVWTKELNTTDKPVIVFIHGGSNIWGGTSDPMYDGEYFVRGLSEGEDCVFVTINYRMSVVGGLDLSVLEGYTDEYAYAMNLSKLDQTQALKWISENIAAWGGDPANVTIMGQSAGGGAVEMLMADPDTHQYFQRAIINSGTQSREAISKERFTSNSKTVCDILGVTTVDELIALTDEDISSKMDEIIDALGKAHPGLRCADGLVISETWWEDLQNGVASDIDLLIGGTDGEEDWFAIDWDNSVSEPLSSPDSILEDIRVRDAVRDNGYGRFYCLEVDGFVDGYLAMGDDPVRQAMDLYNDVYFNYPTYLIAATQAEHNANTYLYRWEYAPAVENVLEYNGDSAEVSPWGRALHCMDLCFELGTKEGYVELTGDPEKMSDTMIAQAREMVYSFAKTGDPSNDLIGQWTPFGDSEKTTMLIGQDGSWSCVSEYRQDVMDYMSQLQPYGVQ
jgi:para-nitrobenzyl esterase